MLGDKLELFHKLLSAHQVYLSNLIADTVFEPVVNNGDLLAVSTQLVDLGLVK